MPLNRQDFLEDLELIRQFSQIPIKEPLKVNRDPALLQSHYSLFNTSLDIVLESYEDDDVFYARVRWRGSPVQEKEGDTLAEAFMALWKVCLRNTVEDLGDPGVHNLDRDHKKEFLVRFW